MAKPATWLYRRKKIKAIEALSTVISKRRVTVHQVQKLTGLLNFLNRAMIPGHTFTRRMYSKFALKTVGNG